MKNESRGSSTFTGIDPFTTRNERLFPIKTDIIQTESQISSRKPEKLIIS